MPRRAKRERAAPVAAKRTVEWSPQPFTVDWFTHGLRGQLQARMADAADAGHLGPVTPAMVALILQHPHAREAVESAAKELFSLHWNREVLSGHVSWGPGRVFPPSPPVSDELRRMFNAIGPAFMAEDGVVSLGGREIGSFDEADEEIEAIDPSRRDANRALESQLEEATGFRDLVQNLDSGGRWGRALDQIIADARRYGVELRRSKHLGRAELESLLLSFLETHGLQWTYENVNERDRDKLVDTQILEIWDGLYNDFGTSRVTKLDGKFMVPDDALFLTPAMELLRVAVQDLADAQAAKPPDEDDVKAAQQQVRERAKAAGLKSTAKYALGHLALHDGNDVRVIDVKVVPCEGDAQAWEHCVRSIEADALAGDEEAWNIGADRWGTRGLKLIQDAHQRLTDYAHYLRAHVAELTDARVLLGWATALLSSAPCEGETKHVAARSLASASKLHDEVSALVASSLDNSKGRVLDALVSARAALTAALTCAMGQWSLALEGCPRAQRNHRARA